MQALRRAFDITPFLKLSPRVKTLAKNGIARTMDLTGLSWAAHRWQVARHSPFIRVINMHDVPPSRAADFDRQLVFYKKRFVPVGYDDLLAFIDGRWTPSRPGLLITFDDGLKSHADVAAPLLEKHGFVGWFFVPIGFVDAPRDQQAEYGRKNLIWWSKAPGDDLGAMTWDDVRRLDQRHVIGCHTWTHIRLSDQLTPEQIEHEIIASKARLEQELGHDVSVFCWVGGEEWSYSAAAAQAIRRAGYRLSFMNARAVVRPGTNPLQLHRICIEPSDPPYFVRYLLSGLLDALYAAQRRRINALTAT